MAWRCTPAGNIINDRLIDYISLTYRHNSAAPTAGGPLASFTPANKHINLLNLPRNNVDRTEIN